MVSMYDIVSSIMKFQEYSTLAWLNKILIHSSCPYFAIESHIHRKGAAPSAPLSAIMIGVAGWTCPKNFIQIGQRTAEIISDERGHTILFKVSRSLSIRRHTHSLGGRHTHFLFSKPHSQLVRSWWKKGGSNKHQETAPFFRFQVPIHLTRGQPALSLSQRHSFLLNTHSSSLPALAGHVTSFYIYWQSFQKEQHLQGQGNPKPFRMRHVTAMHLHSDAPHPLAPKSSNNEASRINTWWGPFEEVLRDGIILCK
jgi:hypothetical protein